MIWRFGWTRKSLKVERRAVLPRSPRQSVRPAGVRWPGRTHWSTRKRLGIPTWTSWPSGRCDIVRQLVDPGRSVSRQPIPARGIAGCVAMLRPGVERGSQLQVEPQGGIELSLLRRRQLADPVAHVGDVDGSDLIGLDLRVRCQAARPGCVDRVWAVPTRPGADPAKVPPITEDRPPAGACTIT